jgi:hypothetical protein
MMAMVSQAPNLKAIVNEDGAVILDIEHDLMSTLNPTVRSWKMVGSSRLATTSRRTDS